VKPAEYTCQEWALIEFLLLAWVVARSDMQREAAARGLVKTAAELRAQLWVAQQTLAKVQGRAAE